MEIIHQADEHVQLQEDQSGHENLHFHEQHLQEGQPRPLPQNKEEDQPEGRGGPERASGGAPTQGQAGRGVLGCQHCTQPPSAQQCQTAGQCHRQ